MKALLFRRATLGSAWRSLLTCCLIALCPSLNQAAPQFQSLFTLGQTDGTPRTAPVGDASGNLYGITTSGGKNNQGTVYKVDPAGTKSVLHHFGYGSDNGILPAGGLSLGPDGSLYGTTIVGGVSDGGILYKIDPAGRFSILHHFESATGRNPDSNLVLAPDGSLYGAPRRAGTSTMALSINWTRKGCTQSWPISITVTARMSGYLCRRQMAVSTA